MSYHAPTGIVVSYSTRIELVVLTPWVFIIISQLNYARVKILTLFVLILG